MPIKAFKVIRWASENQEYETTPIARLIVPTELNTKYCLFSEPGRPWKVSRVAQGQNSAAAFPPEAGLIFEQPKKRILFSYY